MGELLPSVNTFARIVRHALPRRFRFSYLRPSKPRLERSEMLIHRVAAVAVFTLVGCSAQDGSIGNPPDVDDTPVPPVAAPAPDPSPVATAVTPAADQRCAQLRQQHGRSVSGATFERWVKTNWPGGRFDDCLGPPQRPVRQMTIEQERYCYTIAITYAHMRESPGKQQYRKAWFDLGCEAFLGRGLPTGPLPAAEEAKYTAALNALNR